MNWSEEMPDGCPPRSAAVAEEGKVFYRIVKSIPPTEDDFASMQTEDPKRALQFAGKREESYTYGVSLFDDIEAVRKVQSKIKKFKGRSVVELTLKQRDGLVVRTSDHHWTWWKTDDFDISICEEVKL